MPGRSHVPANGDMMMQCMLSILLVLHLPNFLFVREIHYIQYKKILVNVAMEVHVFRSMAA